MTEPSPYEPILRLLGADMSEQSRTKQHARNVQAGLRLIGQKLEDLDAEVLRWKDVWGYANPSPIGILFRAQKVGSWIGVDVPGFTIDDCVQFVRGNLEPVRANARSAAETLAPYVQNPGSPENLRQVGDLWSEQVQRPVSGMISWFSAETLLVDNLWQGSAARAYGDFFPSQHDATKEIAARAASLTEALHSLASSLDTFWTNIDREVSSAVTRVAGLSASVLTRDVLDIAGKAGEAIDGLNQAINNLLGILQEDQQVYEKAVAQLLTMINDNEHFSNGEWPRPGAMQGISRDPKDWTPEVD